MEIIQTQPNLQKNLMMAKGFLQSVVTSNFCATGFTLQSNTIMPEKVTITPSNTKCLLTIFLPKKFHLLEHFKDSPLYDEISNIIDFLTDTSINFDSEFLDRIAIPPVPQFIVDKEILKQIYEALKLYLIVEFDYKGRWNQELSHRRVHPYQLILDDGKYYLYGFSEERNDTRIFSLGNMQNLVITNSSFVLPHDYEFQKQPKNTKSNFTNILAQW